MDHASAQARYRAVRALFEATADLAPAARDAALAAEPDADVRDEVRGLLALDEAPIELAVPGVGGPLPERIGPYRVIREVGRGAMGIVYEAEETSPRRRVALKVVHPWLRTPALDALMRHEAQAMADVRHPGIPSVYALLDVEGAPVVVMELVEGVHATRYAAGLPWRTRLDLLARTCDAVACAHRAGITHRDLKPSNLLVTPEGEPKVLDFGIAGHADRPAPVGSGTVRYMAPEQRQGAAATPASDVYSLAVVAVEVFAAPATVDGEPLAAPVLRGLREDLRAVLRRALSPDPADRYPDAAALAAELRRVAGNRPVDAQAHLWGARGRAALRRHPLLAVGVLLLIGVWIARAPIRRMVGSMRAEARLEAVLRDERGFGDPGVRRALDALLADPRILGSPTAARAFSWKAGHLVDDERLEALAAAWVFATPSAEPGLRDTLARELLAQGDDAAAAALGPFTDPSLREAAALARLDFASPDVAPETARWLARLRTAAPRAGGLTAAALLDDGWLSFAGATMTVERAGAPPVVRTLPHTVDEVATDGVRFAVRGERWVGAGRIDDGALVEATLPSGLPRVVLPSPGLAARGHPPDALFTLRYEGAGLYGLVDGVPLALDPSAAARRLPAGDLRLVDLDGDGADEVVVTATGWPGNELRVLTGPVDALRVAARLRMSAWGVATVPEAPGLLYVLGGGNPAAPVSGGERRSIVPVRWEAGRLVPGTPIPLPFEGLDLFAVDLDGDGRTELLVSDYRQLALVDPAHLLPTVWLPNIRLLATGRPAGADADQLWVALGDQSYVLGASGPPTPARPAPARPAPAAPPPLAGGAFAAAWTRAAGLAELGRPDLAADPLRILAEIAGRAPAVVDQALALSAGRGAVPSAAALPLAERALAIPEAADSARAILRRAHAFDGVTATQAAPSLAREARLGFEGPLPPTAHVGGVGAVRRNALRGRLELDLRGDTGRALSLPLAWDGDAFCVDLALELRELDWATGVGFALRQGEHTSFLDIWRVGGGPRTQHHLNVAVRRGPGTDAIADYAGPHTASVCLSADPGTVSIRVDDAPRSAAPTGWEPGPGTVWLDVEPTRGDYPVDRMARLDLLSVGLRGATLADGPEGPARTRLAAEGDLDTLRALRDGTPWERAIADEALDEVDAATVAGLSRTERRALLRRSTPTWGRVIAAATGPAYAALWAEAWDIPLAYEDPSAWEAVLDPSLQRVAPVGEAQQAVGLLRARSLLEKGRVAAAASTLAVLRDTTPAAWLVTARLELRQGHREAAAAALRTWLARAPSPDGGVDTVADDPELAPVLADLPAAPILR